MPSSEVLLNLLEHHYLGLDIYETMLDHTQVITHTDIVEYYSSVSRATSYTAKVLEPWSYDRIRILDIEVIGMRAIIKIRN